MSTVKEIEAAIRALPPKERAKLVENLPTLLPELNRGALWENDPPPRFTLPKTSDEPGAPLKPSSDAPAEVRDRDY